MNRMSDKKYHIFKSLILIGISTLCVIFIIHWISIEKFRNNVISNKREYFEVKLVNRCLIHEKLFLLEVLGSDEVFDFQNNKSKVYVEKDNKIRLSINQKYSDFFYHNDYRRIKEGMVFIAECSFASSIQEAIKSMREEFSAK